MAADHGVGQDGQGEGVEDEGAVAAGRAVAIQVNGVALGIGQGIAINGDGDARVGRQILVVEEGDGPGVG